jgi:uncharacterized protein YeaO (DUF488 family)
MLKLKRVYDPASSDDGRRFLMERLWPRGFRKDSLRLDGWLKDVAPSSKLRQWFGHDPQRWAAFRERYEAELTKNPEALEPILQAARQGTVTLVYSSRDSEHNNAVALRDYVARLRKAGAPKRKSAA